LNREHGWFRAWPAAYVAAAGHPQGHTVADMIVTALMPGRERGAGSGSVN